MRSSAAFTSLARAPAAGMGGDVQRRADIRFQVLDDGLDCRQLGLGVLLERTAETHEQLTDLALVVGLAAAERERCPERLADLLQQLLERAAPFRRGALDVVAAAHAQPPACRSFRISSCAVRRRGSTT